MPRTGRVLWLLACAACAAAAVPIARAAAPEYNPVRRAPDRHRARRRSGSSSACGRRRQRRGKNDRRRAARAQLHRHAGANDTRGRQSAGAARRLDSSRRARQFTPSMHVLFLQKTLYGADVDAVLEKLRADPAVQFAAVDRLRYPRRRPERSLVPAHAGERERAVVHEHAESAGHGGGRARRGRVGHRCGIAWGITTGSAGRRDRRCRYRRALRSPRLAAGRSRRPACSQAMISWRQDYDPTTGAAARNVSARERRRWVGSRPIGSGRLDQQRPISRTRCSPTPTAQPNSTWHGTRVVGVYGAITNNDVGIAGMTWGSASAPGPWVLPVRALGKCGGYDSDIIAGIEWAAGLPVMNPEGPAVPANPYPADIVNLSLGGGTDSCSSANGAPLPERAHDRDRHGRAHRHLRRQWRHTGAAAPVELPANCSAVVPGVIAVAGLRNVGTKVGYSSFGAGGDGIGARRQLRQQQWRLSALDRHHDQSRAHGSRRQ